MLDLETLEVNLKFNNFHVFFVSCTNGLKLNHFSNSERSAIARNLIHWNCHHFRGYSGLFIGFYMAHDHVIGIREIIHHVGNRNKLCKSIPLESTCRIPAIKSTHSDWYCTESSLFALFASVKSPVITTTSGLINFKVLEQKIWKSFVRRSSLWVEMWMSETWTKWTKLSSDSPLNVHHLPSQIKNLWTVQALLGSLVGMMMNVPGKGAPPTFKLSNLASAPTWKIIRSSDNAPNTRKTVRTTHRWPKFSPKRAISDSFQTFLLDPNLLNKSNIHLYFIFFSFELNFFFSLIGCPDDTRVS